MNKERHIYLGITIALSLTLAITILLYTQQSGKAWSDIAEYFLFPFINTIIGAIIVAFVGTIIANKALRNYNDRLSQGL